MHKALRRFARLADVLGLARLALTFRAEAYKRDGEPEARLLPWLVPRNKLAIDVGAAEGIYSYELAGLGVPVLAFEPNLNYFRALRRSSPGIDLRNEALSNREGSATLRIPQIRDVQYSGWGSISRRNNFPELSADSVSTYEVQVTTLDALDLSAVGFIKIDVEGHEIEVLEGGHRLLSRFHPTILVEVGNESRGSLPEKVAGLLRNLGYELLVVSEQGLLEPAPFPLAPRTSANLIALPPLGALE